MALIRQLLVHYTTNREAYYKAQLVVYFALVEILISTCYYIVHPYFGFRVPRLVFSGLSVTVLIQVLLLRLPVPFVVIAHSLVTTLWISFCFGIATSGGILSLVMPWLSVMPVMANLLINQRAATVWACISLASILVFFLNDVNFQTVEQSHWRSLASNSGLVVTTSVFTWLFHRAYSNLVSKVTYKNKKLEARKNRLISQHREIGAQKSFIEKQNQMLQQQNNYIEKINEQLQLRVQSIMVCNKALEQYWMTLLTITKSYTVNFGRLDEALDYITKAVAQNLGIDRVGIWRYSSEKHTISCVHITDRRIDNTVQEDDLKLEEYPVYYKALMLETNIKATDAQHHWQTRELREKYLVPRKILSLMDSPFFIAGKLAGVVCCEHSSTKNWENEDILFLQAISDIVTITIMSQERRAYEAALIEKQAEIISVNQSLEARVKQRTEELEKQNSQLAEYAYINSHLLRAPLSRLLGLVNLMGYAQIAGAEREEIIKQIQIAGKELDAVVHKINEALGFNRNFDRNFFSEK
jgi:hypothetical protein